MTGHSVRRLVLLGVIAFWGVVGVATFALAQVSPPQPLPSAVLAGNASISATNSSSRVALPVAINPFGALTLVNTGSKDAYCVAGDSTATATTGSPWYLPAGRTIAGVYTSGTYVACITGGSDTTTVKILQANGPVQVGNSSSGGAPSGAASNDLSGTYPGPSVVSFNGGTPFGTAAAASTGTSGATVPLLNGNNTFSGTVKMTTLPTADPHVAGQLWNNAGVLQVSGG